MFKFNCDENKNCNFIIIITQNYFFNFLNNLIRNYNYWFGFIVFETLFFHSKHPVHSIGLVVLIKKSLNAIVFS